VILSAMQNPVIYRVVAIGMVVGWIAILTSFKAWGDLLVSGHISMVPKHHSFAKFAEACSWLPLTLVVLQVAAWTFAGIAINARIALLTLTVAAPFFLLTFLGHTPFMRATIRVHDIHEELASREDTEFDAVPPDISLPSFTRQTPIRHLIAWPDGSYMALSRTRNSEQGGPHLVLWSDVKQPNANPSPRIYVRPFQSARGGRDDELMAIQEALTHSRADLRERVRWVAVSEAGLTVTASPHRNLQDARNLLALGRALRGNLRWTPSFGPRVGKVKEGTCRVG